MNLKVFLFLSIITISHADCMCNSTVQTYPCECQDLESYEICKQAHNTVINYTNIISDLVKPYIDNYYYEIYKYNLKLFINGFYCIGSSTCFVNSSRESCKKKLYYYDCNLMQNTVVSMSNTSSALFVDTDVRNLINNINSKINVSINCNELDKNYIYISKLQNNYIRNNSIKNIINLVHYALLIIGIIILL